MTQIHKIDFLVDTEVFLKSLIEGMEVLGPSTMTSFFLPRWGVQVLDCMILVRRWRADYVNKLPEKLQSEKL